MELFHSHFQRLVRYLNRLADLLFVILQSVARRYARVPAHGDSVETIRVSGPAAAIADAAAELERRGLRVERGG